MKKPLTKKTKASLLLLASIVFTPLVIYAEKLDIEQEILISADRQAGDLKNKIASYIGDVVIKQGTLIITADSVNIYQGKIDEEVYVAQGNPAKFEHILADGSKITLQADEIKYEPAIHFIVISGNALLQQAGSEVKGSKITYNTLTEQLDAIGNSNEKTSTVLQPKQKVNP
ncbi:MAG: lipopolysaccharide export system protein LptA [Alteromonadaceae bacterium]|jgi:lipopolysaccharide export system protein LptA|tara:strand:+ start:1826 stop:2341 length:516 start_codon:yes stop_codon:yes gene_type:complete